MKNYIELAMLGIAILPLIILMFKTYVYSSHELDVIAISKGKKYIVILFILIIFAYTALGIEQDYSSTSIITIIILIIDTYLISLIKFGLNKNILACSKPIRLIDMTNCELINKKKYFILEFKVAKKVLRQKYNYKDMEKVKNILKIN